MIQDTRDINICIKYKDFPKPLFNQGPQYVIYKEQSKIKNHKYAEGKDCNENEDGVSVVQFPPIREQPPPKPIRTDIIDAGVILDSKRRKKEDDPSDRAFDIKKEKKKGNGFWNAASEKTANNSNKPAKKSKLLIPLLTKS